MRDNLKPLLYWCHERESIRLKKAQGLPAPWTKDPILATYRFCNLRRRDDRVSSWLRTNVLTEENIDFDLKSFLMFSAWCRWCNWPPTIKAVMDAGLYPSKKIDWAKIGKLVDTMGKRGKVWTGAYMIRAPEKKGAKKGAFVATQVVGKSFSYLVPGLVDLLSGSGGEPTYRGIWEQIQWAHGYGFFISGQIAGDWTYTTLLNRASDLTTWAPMGPGSVRGFNRIIGNEKLNKGPSEELWLEKLGEWRTAIVKRMGESYADLTALDVQNALCEVDKYLRVKNGQGRPRAKYQPHTY